MAVAQAQRSMAIKTGAGPDVLAITSMTLRHELSRLFHIEVDLISEVGGTVDWDQVVGRPATIRLFVAQKEKRYFHGVVSRLSQGPNSGDLSHYRATIVPTLWLHTRIANCRIFQHLSTPDILKEVLQGLPLKFNLSASYPTREYCVQYRETNFNFVSRLMEEDGIYYYFEHKDGQDIMTIVDAPGAHDPFPGYAEISFHDLERGATEREVITNWTREREVQPEFYTLRDYNFNCPSQTLEVEDQVPRTCGPSGKLEVYDYPGEYQDRGEGSRLADVRVRELQAQTEVLHGQATARGVAVGSVFALKHHPVATHNRDYLITAVVLQVDAGNFASNSPTGDFFSCSFTAIPKAQLFRPQRITPKPLIQGPQTAVVVGPAGEEIHTDKHAQVKVQFHWDREGKKDENSSCWIRVSQVWAGKNWGAIHIPRIGQEVIVEFLEGDPDRPIITGRVYNAEQVPPYALPANKTQSGIKSRSSKGGAGANFNEIRFEDKKGSEEIYIHAEKDQNNLVENNETTWVGHDRTETVDHDETIHIKHDRTETVDNNETITVHNNRTERVDVDETISIGANRTEDVGANEQITVAANRTRNVGQNESVTVGMMRTHTVGVNEAITIGAAQEVTIGAIQAITVGANQSTNVGVDQNNEVGKDRSSTIGKDDSLSVGKKLTVIAGEEILIKTGEASILMKKDGTIKIKGKDISIEGSGEIKVKASKNVTMKGKKILQN